MVLLAIVAEDKPFHSGNLYHIQQTMDKTKADVINGVMSGNYVQRGEPAIFDKLSRAEAAVRIGVDVVLELSPSYAVRSAEYFSMNALKIITSIPEVKYLSFGTEMEEDELIYLKEAAKILYEEPKEFKSLLKEYTKTGISFPKARSMVLCRIAGDKVSKAVDNPNNLLATEYLKSLLYYKSDIIPVSVKRFGADHDSFYSSGNINSASALRKIYKEKDFEKFFSSVPKDVFNIYKEKTGFNYEAFKVAQKANLLKAPLDVLKEIDGISEGLENRIKKALLSDDRDSLEDIIKTKRYPMSRIRRTLLCSYLDILSSDRDKTPKYAKILAYSEKGQKILNTIKKTSNIPLIKNMTSLKKYPELKEIYEKEAVKDRIYDLYSGI